MKLFVVVLGCILVVAFLAWMTASMQQIVEHRDGMRHAQQIAAQQAAEKQATSDAHGSAPAANAQPPHTNAP